MGPRLEHGLRYSVFYCTVWVTDAELLAMFEFPRYVTVTLVEPMGSVEVVIVALLAVLPDQVSWTVPSTVCPAVNVTGPVGLTVSDVICAENVTAWP